MNAISTSKLLFSSEKSPFHVAQPFIIQDSTNSLASPEEASSCHSRFGAQDDEMIFEVFDSEYADRWAKRKSSSMQSDSSQSYRSTALSHPFRYQR